MNGSRHAIYFAPPASHPLWTAGCAWLGRDAADLADRRGPRRPELAGPWRYGFHATLTAPMRLAAGRDATDLIAVAKAIAARHRPLAVPALAVDTLAGFLALRPVEPLPATHPLQRLADDAVTTSNRCRAVPGDAERARRSNPALSQRQQDHLLRWGYPHVFSDWRFHLTLSGPLVDAGAGSAALRHEAERHFAAALAEPLQCLDLAVFEQAAPELPFHLRHRVPLGAA